MPIAKMEFNQIVKTKFGTILESKEFKLENDTKGEVEFTSTNLTIKFVYNERERHTSYFLKHSEYNSAFENWVVEEFLEIKFKPVFGLTSREEKIALWANERSAYFASNRKDFLSGDRNLFKELNEFFEKKNREYNKRFG